MSDTKQRIEVAIANITTRLRMLNEAESAGGPRHEAVLLDEAKHLLGYALVRWDSEERLAWDRFAAASMQLESEAAAIDADAMIVERRKRFP